MKSDQEAIEFLKTSGVKIPNIAVILGSGWNEIIGSGQVKVEFEIGYEALLGVKTTVPGHEGKLVVGELSGKKVAFLQGRFHMYEGFKAHQATAPVRVLQALGMKKLITTAATGAINEHYRVGDFVILDDLISLFLSFDSPLKGPQFADLSQVFDFQMRLVAKKTAMELGVPTREGTYAYLHGPQFESPADKMALKILGADVVGMSTAPETIMARWLGVKVLGLALVTNLAFVKHEHKEVLAQSHRVSKSMSAWLKEIVRQLL